MSYTFNVPCRENNKLRKIVEFLKKDVKLRTFWKCSNVMAIDRMGYTDHGPTHVKIVANSALKIFRILISRKVEPSLVKDYGLTVEDAEVVVVLSSIFHDLGMIVARERHEEYSVLIAYDFLKKYLISFRFCRGD